MHKLPALDGPGLPNIDWSAEGVAAFSLLAKIDDTVGAPEGHGFVTMHRGYLFVPFSSDGGGGDRSGGFAFLDISDPRAVTKVFSTKDDKTTYHTIGEPEYAGNLREPHGYSFSGDVWCMTSNKGDETGLQFWDLADVQAPRKLASLPLPGLSGGDYGSTPWWVFWQGGRIAYVAGTDGGLYVVDASDPAAPELADLGGGLANPIPTGSLGGFRINTVFAVGNLLVIAKSDGEGISTLDISDPLQPTLLDTMSGEVGYSAQVNGWRIYGAHDPARVYDLAADGSISLVGLGQDVASKGGYGAIQDQVFHYGSSSEYVKLDVSGLNDDQDPRFDVIGTCSPGGFSGADWDFGTPLGNMVFMGNDHGGSALVIHQQASDSTPPQVTMAVPADGAVEQALTSRIGLTFSDQVLTESLTTDHIRLRPVGGPALPGRFSNQNGIVNFWPDELLAEDTTYEIVVVADGVQDFAGNATAEEFISRFSTGASIGDPQPSLTITAPADGATVGPDFTISFALDGFDPMPEGEHLHWYLNDDLQAMHYSSEAIMAADIAPGSYTLRLDLRDAAHQPIDVSDQIAITVVASQPSVTITSPADGAWVDTTFDLAFALSDFDPQSAGEHLHWLLDGVDQGPHYSADPIAIGELTLGTHELCLSLNDPNHQPLGVETCITVHVGPGRRITLDQIDGAIENHHWVRVPEPAPVQLEEGSSFIFGGLASDADQLFEILPEGDG